MSNTILRSYYRLLRIFRKGIMQDVFEVVEAKSNTACQWSVIGRIYSHIQVGETVFVMVRDADETLLSYPFTIVSLLMYERPLEAFDPGDVGRIYLEGKHYDVLKNAKVLVKS